MADGIPGRADVDADQVGLKVVAERLAHYAAVDGDPTPSLLRCWRVSPTKAARSADRRGARRRPPSDRFPAETAGRQTPTINQGM